MFVAKMPMLRYNGDEDTRMKLKDILLSYKTKNGLSHEAMARRIGVSRSTYYRWISESEVHLQAETAKRLSHVLGCERSLLEAPGGQIKPLLGTVKAGYDLFAQEQIEDMIEVSERDAKRGDYFLRVCGDSMEGAHIYDGDLIYVQTCDAVQSGQIAVVLIGEEVTVKRVVYKRDLLILEASNPKVEARYFTQQEIAEQGVRILGRVRFVRTDFD